MIKILQILVSLEGSGGVQNRLLDNYLNMDRSKIHMDFIVHEKKIGELEKKVEEIDSKVFHVSRKRGLNIFKNIKETFKIMKNGNYDVIQCHMERGSIVPLMIAYICGIKVRITHTHIAFLDKDKKIFSIIYKIISKIIVMLSTDYFACSRDAAIWLFGKKVGESNNVCLIPNAINIEKFRYSKETRLQYRKNLNLQNKFVIGEVARFTTQKNHIFLLEIFKNIQYKISNSILLLVGDGELEEEIKKLSKKYEIYDKVIFLGSRNDVAKIMQAIDVFVHPALFEGLGNVLIESQAAGLPTFASAGVIPEETHITNLIEYIPLSDVDKWVEKISDYYKYERKDTSDKVRQAGFDCKIQGHILQKRYEEFLNR